MGSSPEMMLRQKSDIRPSAYRDTVDTPFRPNDLPTGILAKNERPEYGAAYRRAARRRRKGSLVMELTRGSKSASAAPAGRA